MKNCFQRKMLLHHNESKQPIPAILYGAQHCTLRMYVHSMYQGVQGRGGWRNHNFVVHSFFMLSRTKHATCEQSKVIFSKYLAHQSLGYCWLLNRMEWCSGSVWYISQGAQINLNPLQNSDINQNPISSKSEVNFQEIHRLEKIPMHFYAKREGSYQKYWK